MILTISIFLLIYAAFAIFFIIFALFNLYHLWRFGYLGFEGFFMTFIFLGGTALILFITYSLLANVDWTYPLLNLDFFKIFGTQNIIGN